jgi:glycosyltransferase involved in cell wall biosynthesis
VLYVGNVGSHQGVEELLQAFELERSRGLECSLVVVGSLGRKAATLSATSPAALFLGEAPPEELAVVYSRCDVLVSPRLRGSNTPMKIYDYLEAGKSILATRVPAHERLDGAEAVVWADPTVEGLRLGLRSAVGDWRKGRGHGARRSGSGEAPEGHEPVLEAAYAFLTGSRQDLAAGSCD